MQFLRRLQRLARESTGNILVRHIFLQHLPATFHTVLVSVGRDTPIEKLAEIANNITDVTSSHMMSIASVIQNQIIYLKFKKHKRG